MKDVEQEEIEIYFDLFSTVNKHYTLDKYIFPKLQIKPINSKKYYIDDTIALYKKHHPDIDISNLVNIKDILQNLATKDTFAQLDDQLILKELYSILFYIEQIQKQLSIVESDDYPDKYFAKYDQDIRELQRISKRNKDQIFNPKDNLPITNKKETTFKWKLFNLYSKDPIIFEYFLNSLVLGNINDIVGIDEMDEEEALILIDMLSYLSNKKTTPNIIKKSLWIIIYFKLKLKLHFTSTESERTAYELMLNLFDYSLQKIDRKIYVKSIINGMAVFGAKRKTHYTLDKLNFLEQRILRDMQFTKKVKDNLYDILKTNIDKPYMTYIGMYPLELLELNSKYSN